VVITPEEQMKKISIVLLAAGAFLTIASLGIAIGQEKSARTAATFDLVPAK
jgi:hypothetical protein